MLISILQYCGADSMADGARLTVPFLLFLLPHNLSIGLQDFLPVLFNFTANEAGRWFVATFPDFPDRLFHKRVKFVIVVHKYLRISLVWNWNRELFAVPGSSSRVNDQQPLHDGVALFGWHTS